MRWPPRRVQRHHVYTGSTKPSAPQARASKASSPACKKTYRNPTGPAEKVGLCQNHPNVITHCSAEQRDAHGHPTFHWQSAYCFLYVSREQCIRTSMTATKVCNALPSVSPNYSLPRAAFNFWEPLHFLDRGYGFQTWETSPDYSIRSWAYILLHLFPARLASVFIGPEKVQFSHPAF